VEEVLQERPCFCGCRGHPLSRGAPRVVGGGVSWLAPVIQRMCWPPPGVASGSGGELDGIFESDREGDGRDGGGGGDRQDDDNTVALAMFHRAWELAI